MRKQRQLLIMLAGVLMAGCSGSSGEGDPSKQIDPSAKINGPGPSLGGTSGGGNAAPSSSTG